MRCPVLVSPIVSAFLLAGGILPGSGRAAAQSSHDVAAGSLVSVSVDVDGVRVPLHHGRGGSGRWYLEAHEGSEYAVRVTNRTSERLGLSLVVDGLDAISGERRDGRRAWSSPARLYVLEPWAETTVRGWRTSLDEVQRFTFVDERASYAERSGKSNARMGWIEVLVYREREPPPAVSQPGRIAPGRDRSADDARQDDSPGGEAGARPRDRETAEAAPQPGSTQASPQPAPGPAAGDLAHPRRSYPGTGWGERTDDPVVIVAFEPERRPAERITLRYEYRETLIALGVLPRPWYETDRLARRERGEEGFAAPPVR